MPSVVIDGIATRYAVTGSGPPLLMYSPGGFDSRLENWSTLGIYADSDILARLATRFTCVTFDRRESGLSGGRVEPIGWSSYVAQGIGLLDHLGIESAFLMGGCVGCSSAVALAVAYPTRVSGMVLFWPAGGPRYRLTQQRRFATHSAFAAAEGLPAVVELAASSTASFTQDPRVGPWVTVLRSDPAFAAAYAAWDPSAYQLAVEGTVTGQFDRDTVPGASVAALMLSSVPALIVPGEDASHAPSAARYLQECLSGCAYWDVPVSAQPASAADRVLSFLSSL